MGKKGTAPPAYVPNMDNSALFEQTLDRYKADTQYQMDIAQRNFDDEISRMRQEAEYTSNLPSIIGADEANIDWDKKSQELKDKMKSEYEAEEAKKKGRSSTIITSPLLDEEDPTTANSILVGRSI